MVTPEKGRKHRMRGKGRADGYFIAGNRRLWNSLPAPCGANQDQVRTAMARALRQWLETHELPAIIAAVLGVIVALSLLLVVGGYFLVTP
jgi:hypothetical protein